LRLDAVGLWWRDLGASDFESCAVGIGCLLLLLAAHSFHWVSRILGGFALPVPRALGVVGSAVLGCINLCYDQLTY